MVGFPKQLKQLVSPDSGNNWQYNPSIKPDGKVAVNVTVYVRIMGPICTHKNRLDLQLTYRERFNDNRLADIVDKDESGAETFLPITGEDVGLLWSPDTFFRNSVSEEKMGAINENSYARIYPDGDVLISRRIAMTMACANLGQNLKKSGKADCSVDIASYGYKVDEVAYFWDTSEGEDQNQSVTVDALADSFLGEVDGKQVSLDVFELSSNSATTATGKYSKIDLNFKLKSAAP